MTIGTGQYDSRAWKPEYGFLEPMQSYTLDCPTKSLKIERDVGFKADIARSFY